MISLERRRPLFSLAPLIAKPFCTKKGFVDFDSSAGAFAHRDGDLQNVSACISRNKYARDAGLTAIGNGKAAFGVALASELLT